MGTDIQIVKSCLESENISDKQFSNKLKTFIGFGFNKNIGFMPKIVKNHRFYRRFFGDDARPWHMNCTSDLLGGKFSNFQFFGEKSTIVPTFSQFFLCFFFSVPAENPNTET